jgi:hypothetical protein
VNLKERDGDGADYINLADGDFQELDDELSRFMIYEAFPDWLNDCYLLKEISLYSTDLV